MCAAIIPLRKFYSALSLYSHCIVRRKYAIHECVRGLDVSDNGFSPFAVNKRHFPYAGLMLCQRLRRWPNIKPT